MKWFQNLSIWLKVMCISLFVLLGFCFYLAFTYVASADMKSQVAGARRLDVPTLQTLDRSGEQLAILSGLYARATNARDEDALLKAHTEASHLEQELSSFNEQDKSLLMDVAQMQAAFHDYNGYANALAEGVLYGRVNAQDAEHRAVHVAMLEHALQASFDTLRAHSYLSLNQHLDRVTLQSRFVWIIGVALGGLFALLLLVVSTVIIKRLIVGPLQEAAETANRIAQGDLSISILPGSRDELGRLLMALSRMRDSLAKRFDDDKRGERIKTCVADLNKHMRGDLGLEQIATAVLNHLVPALNAQVGLFYVWRNEELQLVSSYAFVRRKNVANRFHLGESLVGQAALERKQILVEQLPDNYLAVSSGLGDGSPKQVVVTPIIHEEELRGVLEIGAIATLCADDLEILQQSVESIAIALNSAVSRQKLSEALSQQQEQARKMLDQQEQLRAVNDDLEAQAIQLSASEIKLQQQQEDLKQANTELEEQTQALRASEESLQAQQEELRVINEELEEQAKLLAEQRNELLQKNEELERARELMEEKHRQLELSSKYKSEFLSTMSHELRTPLNSILILSNSLSENKQGNLSSKQIEHAQVIHSAGADLLTLINDILDIAKVEEGKMQLVIEPLRIAELAEGFSRNFEHVAQHRGLYFRVEVDDDVPDIIYSDRQRLEQVLRNFFSNAFKFTHHGGITLSIHLAGKDTVFRRLSPNGQTVIGFSCRDTGIGVPKDKQELIFEAFQQADGTTSRKYGGTGLGLTISRELGYLLGGEVQLLSQGEGSGSTFTLFLPQGAEVLEVVASPAEASAEPVATPPAEPKTAKAPVARPASGSAEKTLLIVDDDVNFSEVVADLARDYHFRALVAHDGETGLELATEFRPDAIILDLGLPGIDGLEVMRRLKENDATRNIPVHFFSGRDEKEKAIGMGAVDYLIKPVNLAQIQNTFSRLQEETKNSFRKLLVVEDSSYQHDAIVELFAEHQVEVTICSSGQEALNILQKEFFDCMILDLSLPDMDGFTLLEALHNDERHGSIPVIVYTGRDLSREEESKLRKYADRIILKTERSAERLLSEVSLFLHWIDSQAKGRGVATQAVSHRDDVFFEKNVLVVDDDMRNIYALSSSLEEWGCSIIVANNGRESLEALEQHSNIDIVLMDIMMPEMDGYEAMRRIRAQERFSELPILALTAKAMKDDRTKCLEAGANDYISKPIDIEKLQSLMRVWLHQAT